MKYIIALFLSLTLAPNVYAAAEIKEVCTDKKDKNGKVIKDKEGKTVQECKKIKVHKKLEGTAVPDQKK